MIAWIYGVVAAVLVATMAIDAVRVPRHAIRAKVFAGHQVLWMVVGYLAAMSTLHLHSDVQVIVVIALGMVGAVISGSGRNGMTAVTLVFVAVVVGGLLAPISARTMAWESMGAVFITTFCAIFFALRRESTSNR